MSIKAKTEYFAPQGAFLLAEIALGRFGIQKKGLGSMAGNSNERR